jgi:hypothetical protein
MVAAFWKKMNVVQLLLENEADVEKTDSNCWFFKLIVKKINELF